MSHPHKLRCARFHSFGKPEDVVSIEHGLLAQLGEGQILVRMLVSPVNPADINFILGNYGIRPELPCTPGIEGCSEVLESKAAGFFPGDHVIFLQRVGTWQSHLVCDADAALVIDKEIDPLQASMLKVNPVTAWRLLTGFQNLQPGDWVLQNAANSGVGQCLIQIAAQMGLRTVNMVRREGLDAELKSLGADHVLIDGPELTEQVARLCGPQLPKLACNAVGGDSALRQMDAMAELGSHITYGAMSMRSLKVPNKFLIFKRLRLEGLWITKWLAEIPRDEVQQIYAQLGQWVKDGKLTQAIDTIYRPDAITQALNHAQQSKRNGKVVIDWRS